jgi:hypothetical protein
MLLGVDKRRSKGQDDDAAVPDPSVRSDADSRGDQFLSAPLSALG